MKVKKKKKGIQVVNTAEKSNVTVEAVNHWFMWKKKMSHHAAWKKKKLG